MMLMITLRSFAFLLFLMMLAFALLQLNDPDPLQWTAYYLICSLVPLILVFKRFSNLLFWLAVALSLIVMGIYTLGTLEYLRHASQEPLMQSMNPTKPYIEEAREFIGGFIALCVLVICRMLWRAIDNSSSHGNK